MYPEEILFGDEQVGKSSIVRQYVHSDYSENYILTIGVDISLKTLSIQSIKGENLKIKFQIWDTPGNIRFQDFISPLCKGASGIIFVFDVGRRKTLEKIYALNKIIEDSYSKTLSKVLVGNKCDNIREVSFEEAMQTSNKLGMIYIEVSAKYNIGMNEIFQALINLRTSDE
ncbi:hypothetical protein SteCoe_26986 [Stentor coeruleus]|uniref:GTP-binding protein n=1 Tax=Stentor coeruleus TaxID=5963 RepID=A0A1R2BBM3_9CILI|nr:hypothetical protein SteCoe_26986 [Stentor coeruleus]